MSSNVNQDPLSRAAPAKIRTLIVDDQLMARAFVTDLAGSRIVTLRWAAGYTGRVHASRRVAKAGSATYRVPRLFTEAKLDTMKWLLLVLGALISLAHLCCNIYPRIRRPVEPWQDAVGLVAQLALGASLATDLRASASQLSTIRSAFSSMRSGP